MRASCALSFLGKTFHLKFQTFDTPIEPTAGISARIPHTTEYVILLDYDNVVDPRLRDELVYLQELHHLGDFHVFATNEFGRHVACIDRLPLRKALQVVHTSTCDFNFKQGVRINEYRTWILRALEKGNRPKPKYLYSIESNYNGRRLQSEAHGLFFLNYYGAQIRLAKPDGNTELEVQGYKTGSKINVKDLETKIK